MSRYPRITPETEKAVLAALLKGDKSKVAVAAEFGIHPTTAYSILSRWNRKAKPAGRLANVYKE